MKPLATTPPKTLYKPTPPSPADRKIPGALKIIKGK